MVAAEQSPESPEATNSVGDFHRPGAQVGCAAKTLGVAVLLLAAALWFSKTVLAIAAGLFCLLCAVGLAKTITKARRTYRRDQERNDRCPDCGDLLRFVRTFGCNRTGTRWDGYGFYCPRCDQLKPDPPNRSERICSESPSSL